MEVSSFVTTLLFVILAISTTTNATKGGKHVEKPKVAASFLPLAGLIEETTTEEATTEEPEMEGRTWGMGSRDPCHLPKEKGKCKGKLKRYFYDTRIRKCVEFEYGGCGGNLNKFEDKNACRAACEKPNLAVQHAAEIAAIKKPKTTTNLHPEMTTTSHPKVNPTTKKPKKNSTTTTAPSLAKIEGRTLEGKKEDKDSKSKHGKSPDHPSNSGKNEGKKDKKGKDSHESDSGNHHQTTKKPKIKGHH